jgi:hypothetical protein
MQSSATFHSRKAKLHSFLLENETLHYGINNFFTSTIDFEGVHKNNICGRTHRQPPIETHFHGQAYLGQTGYKKKNKKTR